LTVWCRDEGVEFHARLVYPHHRGIGLEVALVGNRVEHLRNEAAIGHGDLPRGNSISRASFLARETRSINLESPRRSRWRYQVFTPSSSSLYGLAMYFAGTRRLLKRMDLAGDDLREGAHVGAVERVGGEKPRPGMDFVEILDDRERLR